MSREYPLAIQDIGEDVYMLMSKGHHDVHDFMRQVRADQYDWPLGMPEHLWLRAVPHRDGGVIYVEGAQGERGVFPVTCVSEAWGPDTYEAIVAAKEPAPKAPLWSPIDSAPKDGTEILGYSETDDVFWVCWYDQFFHDFRNGTEESFEPTHWQPLPPRPQQGAKKDSE